MNYEKRFLAIRDFLNQHTYLHELEMLERFEKEIDSPYAVWIEELSKLKEQDIIDIENNFDDSKIKNQELKEFIQTAKLLSEIPKLELKESSLPSNIKRKMSSKKVHEISLIKSLLKGEDIEQFIDIGSGAAHLSSALVDEKRKSICVDMNENFQLAGKRKIERWTPELKDKIKFINKQINSRHDIEDFDNSMILGLHSCGALSTHIIELIPKRLVNFSCCYHKLKEEYNLSQVAKGLPIWFSNHAKTSAAKGFAWTTPKNYKEKYKVKTFRYTLHFLLIEEFGIGFTGVGNGKKSDYESDFSQYARDFSPRVIDKSSDEINKYFDENQVFINKVIAAGTLRSLLSRLIELYIILDRALFLIENQKKPKVFELFKREISPRNISIFL